MSSTKAPVIEEESLAVETEIKARKHPHLSTTKKTSSAMRLQLYNPSHKIDLLKLFAVKVERFGLDSAVEGDTSAAEKGDDYGEEFKDSDNEEEDDIVVTRNLGESGAQNRDFITVNVRRSKGGKFLCNACEVGFDELTELRDHNRLDWHRYNLKRKIHGQPSATEGDFGEMMDDLSSIEGSDSEDEDFSKASSSAGAVTRLVDKMALELEKEESKPLSRLQAARAKLFNSPKAYFETDTGHIFTVFKTIVELGAGGASIDAPNLSSGFIQMLNVPLSVAIIMCSGGHFAAAIFKGGEVMCHKTFHSYTVRAKQGGSQGTRDSKNGTSHPKSAGASLRRYNEQSLTQHVQDLIDSWKSKVAACQIIFYRAISSNSNVLFGGKNPPLKRDDPKLRTIPFPTKRPTFSEIKRVHSLMTLLHVYENKSEFVSEHQTCKPKSKKGTGSKIVNRAKSRSPKRADESVLLSTVQESSSDVGGSDLEEILQEIDLTELKEYGSSFDNDNGKDKPKRQRRPRKPNSEKFEKPSGIFGLFLAALSQNDSLGVEANLAELKNIFLTSKETAQSSFIENINASVDVSESNFLHVASKKNNLQAVWDLLDLGCEPVAKDKAGKVPYNYAESKECRAVFRRFMGQFPEKYDYKKGQIPAPITEEIEAEKAERKKIQNKLKREKDKLKKQEKKEKDEELQDKERFLQLSDREKRALAAEQRILAQCKRNGEQKPVLARCFDCACDMTGKVPFEYNQNIFCTTKCLNVHRKKFPTVLSA